MGQPGEAGRLAAWVRGSLVLGLSLGGLALLAGLAVVLVFEQPRPEGPPPALLPVIRGAASGDGAHLMNVGLLLLMATPVARVVVLGLGWALEREWRFAAVALGVLALLGVSLSLGVN